MVSAFGWGEGFERCADRCPKGVSGSGSGLSEQRLEFGEGIFDRIEVGAVGRQEAQPRTRRLDDLAHRSALVAPEIVHDDGVARAEQKPANQIDCLRAGAGEQHPIGGDRQTVLGESSHQDPPEGG